MTQLTDDIQIHWAPIAPILSLRNEQEYDAAVGRLNALVDDVGTDETHPLYGLLDTLSTLVHAYEEEHERVPSAPGPDVLRFLMDEHGLKIGDVPEIGVAEAVRSYLAGERELSVGQVRALANRFRVSPAIFVD